MEQKAASLVIKSEKYIPGKGKVYAKAYQISLVQHIFVTHLLCARHCSRRQVIQTQGEEGSRQKSTCHDLRASRQPMG